MRFAILYAGRDPELVRQWTKPLTMAGYRVVAVIDPLEIIGKLFSGEFDLILLCESLPKAERGRLARLARDHGPSIPILIIDEQEGMDYDLGVRAVLGQPDKIVAAVQNSLN